MQSGFWKKFTLRGTGKKPIMAIAPMSGVTDEAFRLMFLKYGRPDVFWTEFVPVAGLFSKGREHCLKVLRFSPKERPIVAQIFGSDPLQFEKATEEIVKLGFDGIDINMGCPDRDIEKQGAGAALIKDFELAKKIIRAVKKGASLAKSRRAGKIPVSVKTRIGYGKNQISEWIPALLEENIAALIVHFRTRNELYFSPAHWELAEDVAKLRDKYSPETLILGNGDVKSLAEAKKLAKETGLDGIMIGRGVLGNPWFFPDHLPTVSEKLSAVAEHAEIFGEFFEEKQFDSIKKHFHAYTKGFKGAKDLRERLMKVKNLVETKKVIENFISNL
jgi:nifR3 family TIM-barrel protein